MTGKEKPAMGQLGPQEQTIDFVLLDPCGLHARPSSRFATLASQFSDHEIEVFFGERKSCGKSILGLLTLAAPGGNKLTVRVAGPDTNRVLAQLMNLEFLRSEEHVATHP